MMNNKFGWLIKRINLYPPFIGAGIRVRSYDDAFTRFEVVLRSRWYYRNLFGTHFGGSLYAMSDSMKCVEMSMSPASVLFTSTRILSMMAE